MGKTLERERKLRRGSAASMDVTVRLAERIHRWSKALKVVKGLSGGFCEEPAGASASHSVLL
jgi:hypothetical protein